MARLADGWAARLLLVGTPALAATVVLWSPGRPAGATEGGPLSAARARWSTTLAGAVGHPWPMRGPGGVVGIVVTQSDGSVTLTAPSGRPVWRARLDLPADAGAVSATLRPGEGPSVIATDVWGSVYRFDGRGKRVWKLPRASRSGGFRTPTVVDLDGDGMREIIVTDSRGALLVIGADGRIRLNVAAGNYRVSGPAVVEAGARERHLIFGNDAGDVFRLTARGELLWACRPRADAGADVGRFGRSLPVVLAGRSGPVVLMPCSFVSNRPGLAMLDAATGDMRGRGPSEVQTYQSTVVADLNGDGVPSALFGDKNSQVYCLDASGKRLWATRLPGRGIFHAPAVLRSGTTSLIVQTVRGEGADGKAVYALDGHGRLGGSLALPGGGGSSPLVCRFAGESGLSLVTLSATGVLERHDLGAPWDRSEVLWAGPPEPRVVASPMPSRPVAVAGPLVRTQAVMGANVIAAHAPTGAAYAAIRAVHASGRAVSLVRLAKGGAARLTVRLARTGRHAVDIRWAGPGPRAGEAANRREMELDLALSLDAEQQLAFEAAVVRTLAGAPHRRGLRECLLHRVRGGYADARARFDPDAFDRVRIERQTALAVAALAARARADHDVVAVPISNPWGSWSEVAILRERGAPNALEITMVGNERESRALMLVNLTARAMTVRVERGALRSGTLSAPGDRVVRLHEPAAVTPTTTGVPTYDALPLLGEAATLRLGPGECRPVWLTVSSSELGPGLYTGDLRIGDTASPRSPTVVSVSVRVSRIRLPDRLRYRHCNWLYPASYADQGALERVLTDALEHGTNVFVIPPPTVRLDRAGLAISVEGAQHDWLARRLQGRAFLLIGGAPSIVHDPDVQRDGPSQDAAFAVALQAYAAHMRRLGWDHRDYVLYLQDEPGLVGPDAGFRAYVELVRRVKAACPEMGVYANPAGGATPAMLAPLSGLVLVWCPDMHLYRTDPKGFEPIFRSGREWWHYEAPADQRNLSALGFYRMQAWVAFAHGMQGAAYWVHSSDPYWFDPPGRSSEYGVVYMTDGVPVATRRWEATRDGIEDYELLSMLRDAADRASGPWADDARRALREAVAEVTRGQESASDIGRQTEPFEPDFRRWMRLRAGLVALLERAP